VIFSKQAKAEREHAIGDLALDSPQAAATLIRRFNLSARLLGQQPYLGCTGHEEGTREWVIPKSRYLFIYRVNEVGKRVEVLRVQHTSQDR
jgi:toxin ParE1/3/4